MIKQLLFIAAVFLATPTFGVIIDDFSVGPTTLSVDWDNRFAGVWQTGLDPNDVIGGSRIISLEFDSVSQTEQAVATVDTNSQTFNLDVNVGLAAFFLEWGRPSNIAPISNRVELNADLLADGGDAFRIDVMVSAAPQLVMFAVQSGVDEGVPNGAGTGMFFPATDTPFSIRLPFSRFADVDFTDVDFIRFGQTTISRGQDFTLDAIRTVPEPSTLVAFILGLIGIMWMRLRR